MLGDDYHRVSVGDFLRAVDRFSANTSVISFAVEAAVLGQMSLTGLPLPKLQKALPTKMFSIEIPPFRTDRDRLTMFTPAQFNFPFIDAIICHTSITKANEKTNILREANLVYKTILFPAKITLTPKKHKSSELGFFKSGKRGRKRSTQRCGRSWWSLCGLAQLSQVRFTWGRTRSSIWIPTQPSTIPLSKDETFNLRTYLG